MVVCEILGVECGAFGIGCSFEWLAAKNTVDFGIGENLEVRSEERRVGKEC